MDLTAINDRLHELKYLIKGDDWSTLSSRIDALCRSLALVKVEMQDGAATAFDEADVDIVETAKTTLRGFEATLTRKGVKPPSTPKALSTLESQIIVPLTQVIDTITGVQHRAKLLSSRK